MSEVLHVEGWELLGVPVDRVVALLRAWGPQAACAERVLVWRLLLRLRRSAMLSAWCTRAQPWVAHALGRAHGRGRAVREGQLRCLVSLLCHRATICLWGTHDMCVSVSLCGRRKPAEGLHGG